jgi:bifunctional non-homologous end joining protein LigD
VKALAAMPDETVIDGEVVASDATRLPSFNALQNFMTGATQIVYYGFDAMMVDGHGEKVTADLSLS